MSRHIGIFWLFGDRVVGLTESPDLGEEGLPGLVDSSYTHAQSWDGVRATCGIPSDLEYDDLARGRVQWHKPSARFRVLGDGKLVGAGQSRALTPAVMECRRLILGFFGLAESEVVWLHDAHYTTGRSRIDRLLDE